MAGGRIYLAARRKSTRVQKRKRPGVQRLYNKPIGPVRYKQESNLFGTYRTTTGSVNYAVYYPSDIPTGDNYYTRGTAHKVKFSGVKVNLLLANMMAADDLQFRVMCLREKKSGEFSANNVTTLFETDETSGVSLDNFNPLCAVWNVDRDLYTVYFDRNYFLTRRGSIEPSTKNTVSVNKYIRINKNMLFGSAVESDITYGRIILLIFAVRHMADATGNLQTGNSSLQYVSYYRPNLNG